MIGAYIEIYSETFEIIKRINKPFSTEHDAKMWIIRFKSTRYIGGLDDGTFAINVGVGI